MNTVKLFAILFPILLTSCEAKLIKLNYEANLGENVEKFLVRQSDNFKVKSKQNVTVIMGRRDDGKTTLSLLLTDREMDGVRVSPVNDEYLTADPGKLIKITSESKRMFPALMIDESNNMTYYDWTGFEDPRGIEYDALVSHLMQNLTKSENLVKFIFVIPHSAVKPAFLDFANHVTSLIKDVDKYKNSIAIVVTKARNCECHDTNLTENDENEVKSIAGSLEAKKSAMEKSIKEGRQSDQYNYKQIIKFINVLLLKKNENYQRIRILRRPDRTGSVMKMPALQDEKVAIRLMIKNLKYVKPGNDDFGYAISYSTKNKIFNATSEIFDLLKMDAKNIGSDIKKTYMTLEKDLLDVGTLYSEMETALQKVSKLQSTDPKTFFTELYTTLNDLSVPLSPENSRSVLAHFKSLKSLKNIYDRTPQSINVSDGLQDIKTYFNESTIWYSFANTLRDILIEEEENIQKNYKFFEPTIKKLMKELSISPQKQKNINTTSLKKFLVEIDHSYLYDKLNNLTVNFYKMKAIYILLKQATNIIPTSRTIRNTNV